MNILKLVQLLAEAGSQTHPDMITPEVVVVVDGLVCKVKEVRVDGDTIVIEAEEIQ